MHNVIESDKMHKNQALKTTAGYDNVINRTYGGRELIKSTTSDLVPKAIA